MIGTIVLIVLAWWLVGLVIVLITLKIDKKPFYVKHVKLMSATALLGPLVLFAWVIVSIGTWMENNQNKRIF